MGVELLKSSKVARQVIERLETRLLQLPMADRPQWSLMQELEKDPLSSRIGEATLSQPLCTAVQILQVELLRAAGIDFAAVVGHSSGEIAAAYAAGFISAEDAICIAYYRGLHSKLASGPDGKPGAMMAIGTSAEDMQELCDDPDFQGRAGIAAVNSPVSVTVSGDRDAIEELKLILDDEKKFARLLKVDKAYHSHHMLPCSEAYLNSMAALDIHADDGGRSTWFSSVLNGEDMSGRHELLKGMYWDSNMISPVLFEKAVTNAYSVLGPFDCTLEVGPHPALKGPTLQTIQEISGSELPYTGLFRRNTSAVESVAEGLGYVWSRFGKDAVDLQKYDRYVSEDSPCRLVKGLPTYAWDHDEYWNESRYAKAIRLRPGPVHELLGHMTPDSNDQDMRWRHILKPVEIPWLMGHRLQNQIVFPAAGYVVTALEAAMAMCKQKRVLASLIELSNVEFGRALVFEADSSNVEVITSLAGLVRLGPGLIEANFRYHAADGKVDSSLNLMATARVHISLGEPCHDALPAKARKPSNLVKVRPDDFYSASRDLEYQWAGPFVALDKLERKLGATEGVLNVVEPSGLLLHPALVDASFQGVLLAYSFPDDGQLWTIHVPRKIKRLVVNPSLCVRETGKGKPLPFASSHDPEVVRMIGNVDIFPGDPDLENAILQIEGLECVPLARASAQDDKEAFATVVWDVASPDPQLAIATDSPVTEEERELAGQLERMARFHVRKHVREAPADYSSLAEGPYARLRYATEVIPSDRAVHTSLWRPEWENDTHEQLISACQPFAQTVEMRLLRLIGDSLPGIFKADNSSIKLDNMLAEQFYSDALGLRTGNRRLARTVKQLTHRYPHLDILEIGAGTGATTKAIFREIGPTFSSYAFTDVSSGPIESTKPWAAPHLHKMAFKTLDIRQDPVAQGFVEQSYDLVVASFVWYSGAVLKQVLQNARRLLKPGGYLILLELLPSKSLVYPLIFGAIPELCQGADEEGRALSPAMSLSDWNRLLQDSGFSGCDTSAPTMLEHSCISPFTVLVSEAMDGKTTFLRHPLKFESDEFFKPGTLIEDLVIIGGANLEVARLVEQITSLVQNQCGNVKAIRALPDLLHLKISSKTTVLSLAELEDPIFQHLGHEQWEALKEMVMTVGVLLWITQGRRAKNPFANIMGGLMRSVIREVPTISYQILDFEDARRMDAHSLSEALLRLQAGIVWQRQDKIRTSVENELVFDQEGRLTIPRLIINKEMNDRYNSSKRAIMDRFDSRQKNIRVAPVNTQSGYELMQEPEPSFEDGTGVARMEVTLSLLSAIRVAEFGCMFLKLGKQGASENHLIALSDRHSSITNSWDYPSVTVDLKEFSKTLFFSLVVHHLLASVLLRSLSRGDVVLVLEPEPGFATILANDARRIGVHVAFVTASLADKTPPGDPNWLNIHPSTPDRVLSRLLPTGISVFVDLAAGKESESVSSRIRSLLSTHCRTDSTKTLFTGETWAPPSSQIDEIQKRLQDAVVRATRTLAETNEIDNLILPIIQPGSLAEAHNRPVPFSLLDWTGCSDVPVRIRSIDTQISFSGQKTYWFAGLSGGLGIALCEWMARHGASYFVISSRNPKIDGSWSETMRELGVVVKSASW
jgi:acyl transferase domain-containing protein